MPCQIVTTAGLPATAPTSRVPRLAARCSAAPVAVLAIEAPTWLVSPREAEDIDSSFSLFTCCMARHAPRYASMRAYAPTLRPPRVPHSRALERTRGDRRVPSSHAPTRRAALCSAQTRESWHERRVHTAQCHAAHSPPRRHLHVPGIRGPASLWNSTPRASTCVSVQVTCGAAVPRQERDGIGE